MKKDHAFRRNENLLMGRYKDKKEMHFLYTIHEVRMERAPKRGREDLGGSKLSSLREKCPIFGHFSRSALVNDYNKYMGGVDCNDALIGNYTSVRKTYKWTMKVVFHFVEEAVLNAFILGEMRFMNYQMEVIKKSLQRASATDERNTDPEIGRHFLQLIPLTEKKTNP